MQCEYPKRVNLKDGRPVTLRPLEVGDFERLLEFFRALPPEDRLFLRHDVCDPQNIRKRTDNTDDERVTSIVAEDGGKIVGDGTLHTTPHGWMRHIGFVRVVTARSHRHVGLGTMIIRELVNIGEERGLEKLQVQLIADDRGSFMMCQALGFEQAAVLKGAVKDQEGRNRDLAIMMNDVGSLSRIMEDWINDMMISTFRVPGGGM
jgi:L-amino acid N-acyltransferase YncA